MKLTGNSHKWMERGIVESESCRKSFKATKIHAMNAGHAFAKAREGLDGEFVAYLAKYEHQVSKTTVYRYMEFFEAALAWAADQNPQLKNKPDELLKSAYEVVLQSPKPFIALMRQLGDMRKFGEYDSVKYATKKLSAGSNAQIEFAFDDVFSTVDILSHLGDENYQINYPEGKDSVEALTELEAKLDSALTRVRQIKQHGRVIEA
jgi:hypothetical protein